MAANGRGRHYRGGVQLAYIPSPTRSALFLGPVPIRFYALFIVTGIIIAIWLGDRRWRARGGRKDEVLDVAGWAVVFGIIGGRIYHLITDPELYFLGRPGTSPWNAFKIWDGGLGIWGAVALGMVGAWIGCRRKGIRLSSYADTVVPGVILAQAIGRLGNYFNNELYGRLTSMPWGLQIHRMDLATGRSTGTLPGLYQPTFLYELLWDLGVFVLLLWADRRFRLGNGRVMALYAMGYTAGRAWVEALRSDYANHILGLRVNDWVSILVFLGGLAWFLTHRGPREATIYRQPPPSDGAASDGRASAGTTSDGAGDEQVETAGNHPVT